jgi:hypothetical protein
MSVDITLKKETETENQRSTTSQQNAKILLRVAIANTTLACLLQGHLVLLQQCAQRRKLLGIQRLLNHARQLEMKNKHRIRP